MTKATKPFQPVIVTANDLRSGAVQFRMASGVWSSNIDAAALAETPEAADALLALAKLDQERALLIDPMLIEVVRDGDALRPRSLRERIRAYGPTIAMAGGKEQTHVSL